MSKMKIILIIILAIGISSVTYGQSELDSLLSEKYPLKTTISTGSWVYSPDASVQKVDAPLVKEIISNFSLYEAQFTYFPSGHVYKTNCLILYDRKSSLIKLIEPRWIDGIQENFLRLFIGVDFPKRKTLLDFLDELQHLVNIGSSSEFKYINSTPSEVRYAIIENYGGKKTRTQNRFVATLDKNKIKALK